MTCGSKQDDSEAGRQQRQQAAAAAAAVPKIGGQHDTHLISCCSHVIGAGLQD